MNGIFGHRLVYAFIAQHLSYGTKHYSYREVHLAALSQKEDPSMSNKCTVPATSATNKTSHGELGSQGSSPGPWFRKLELICFND